MPPLPPFLLPSPLPLLPQWEKLQRRNEELGERADTAEYQIATISQEYRKLIQEKDVGATVSFLFKEFAHRCIE